MITNILTVLTVDDEQVDRIKTNRVLKQNGKLQAIIEEAENIESAKEKILSKSYDCILLDYYLPDGTAIDLINQMKENSDGILPPIIVLTGAGDEEVGMHAISAGAQDYVVKNDYTYEILARIVRYSIQRQTLLKEKEQLIQQLQEALDEVRELQELLPICSYCKKIRDDDGFWSKLESYFEKHGKLKFTHSVCPECYEKMMLELNFDSNHSSSNDK